MAPAWSLAEDVVMLYFLSRGSTQERCRRTLMEKCGRERGTPAITNRARKLRDTYPAIYNGDTRAWIPHEVARVFNIWQAEGKVTADELQSLTSEYATL